MANLLNPALSVLGEAFVIISFVLVMMLLVEYLNVLTRGIWQARLARNRMLQYLLAALLGAAPGCLGVFAVVVMYSHRLLTLGAVVAAMAASSGDEAFIMLSLFPERALLVFGALFLTGVGLGALTDGVLGRRGGRKALYCEGFDVHREDDCDCLPRGRALVKQWKELSPVRAALALYLVLFMLALGMGWVAGDEWAWVRGSLLVVGPVGLFVVATVPDHFLEKHLWRHVVIGHLPGLLLWTLGALAVLHLLMGRFDPSGLTGSGKWMLLAGACLIGLIPESGPHIIFTVLYAKGALPLSVLFANSIVQDGHGMLPLLAHSRRAFVGIKLIKLVAGAALGGLGLALGW